MRERSSYALGSMEDGSGTLRLNVDVAIEVYRDGELAAEYRPNGAFPHEKLQI